MSVNTDEERIAAIASHIKEIISLVGENPTRQGLLKTPMRAAKALWKATEGYRKDIDSVINGALFDLEGSGMVMVRDIEFYSQCEHHILPFFGTMSVAYMPGDSMIGISKLARLVDVFARRLQVQERLTAEVCREVERVTGARGVMVACTAQHLCMKMRGVEKQNASTVTVETSGCFNDDPGLRARFFEMLQLR